MDSSVSSVRFVSRIERVREYIERQYVTEEGTIEENVEALFSDRLAYQVGDQTLTRDEVVAAVAAVRTSPREGRRVEPSDFREEGDMVVWRISATIPGMGEGGSIYTQDSELRAVFDDDDRIIEVWSRDVDSGDA